jgi:hypothetical protein
MSFAFPILILVMLAAVVAFHAYTQRDSNDHE